MKRHFEVKLVKDQVSTNTGEPDPKSSRLVEYAAIATVAGQRLAKGTALLVGGYMAADMLRQVVIHTAQTKIK